MNLALCRGKALPPMPISVVEKYTDRATVGIRVFGKKGKKTLCWCNRTAYPDSSRAAQGAHSSLCPVAVLAQPRLIGCIKDRLEMEKCSCFQLQS